MMKSPIRVWGVFIPTHSNPNRDVLPDPAPPHSHSTRSWRGSPWRAGASGRRALLRPLRADAIVAGRGHAVAARHGRIAAAARRALAARGAFLRIGRRDPAQHRRAHQSRQHHLLEHASRLSSGRGRSPLDTPLLQRRACRIAEPACQLYERIRGSIWLLGKGLLITFNVSAGRHVLSRSETNSDQRIPLSSPLGLPSDEIP